MQKLLTIFENIRAIDPSNEKVTNNVDHGILELWEIGEKMNVLISTAIQVLNIDEIEDPEDAATMHSNLSDLINRFSNISREKVSPADVIGSRPSRTLISHREDDWKWANEDLWEAVQNYIEEPSDVPTDGVITLYQGREASYRPSMFLPDISEVLNENACDNNEYAEDWMMLSKEQNADLQGRVDALIDQWCLTNDELPNFYQIRDIKPIQVRIIGYDGQSGFESAEIVGGEE